MTINSITGKNPTALTIKTAPKAETNGAQNSAAGNSAEKIDSVAITTVAKEIHKAFQSSAAESAIDFERVAAVKKALADGSYSINAERIAKKMIQYEKQMSEDST